MWAGVGRSGMVAAPAGAVGMGLAGVAPGRDEVGEDEGEDVGAPVATSWCASIDPDVVVHAEDQDAFGSTLRATSSGGGWTLLIFLALVAISTGASVASSTSDVVGRDLLRTRSGAVTGIVGD